MFVARNMTRMALEEAQYAIEKSPEYLPAHRRLADILAKDGRTQEASAKLNLVANVYLMRGNPEKAADLFTEVIELWPADMAARERVIDMLKEQGRVSDVIKQYAELGDFYYRLMADPAKATQVYMDALHYSRKNSATAPEMVVILKALADIEAQQLNWNKALDYYQQVMAIAPDDQETALAVVDLNFQTSNTVQAVSALDTFIRTCITRGQTEKIVSTLEDQTRKYPNEVAIRQRLADVYRQQKRTADAIAQMDAIGELLLDQGRIPEAAEVIKSIIEMNPPDIEGYKSLLGQLESR
jgi:tetratricopeptide (TPR) repeat protein